MFILRVNRQVQLSILLLCFAIAIAVGITLYDGSQAAGQVYGQTAGTQTTSATQTTAGTQPAPESKPQTADTSRPAFNNSESIIQLLKDSKEAVKTYGANNMGASFHEIFSISVDGSMTYANADGHIKPPDKMSVNAEVHAPGGQKTIDGYTYEYGPQQFNFEGRITDGSIFIRIGDMKQWFSAKLADLSDLDEGWEAVDYTQFIINPEYMGQETTKEGLPVYHVRIGIDAAKVTEEAEKHIKPKVCDKAKEEIAKLASSVITADIWVGVNDKLVYQVTEKFLNTDLMIAYDDTIELYKWGEKVDILPPASQDVTTFDLGDTSDSSSCPA